MKLGFIKKKWTGAGRGGRLSKQEKKGRRKREEGVGEEGVGGILNCTVRIYPTNVFCCTPKFHRNFDPRVIKTKRTKVSISVLRDLPLVCVRACVCVYSHMFWSTDPHLFWESMYSINRTLWGAQIYADIHTHTQYRTVGR